MLSLKLQNELYKLAREHYQLKPIEVEVVPTRDMAHGDFTSNVAMKVASRWGVTPRVAGETLLQALNASKVITKYCAKVEIAGAGFINFYLKPEILLSILSELTKRENLFKAQKIIVEYSSPNIAKPMHIGHIRSTIIGEAVANLYEQLGAKVIRLNHLGDWGTQFGKLIAAYKMWGSKSAVHKNPIDELLKLYVRFHEEMKTNLELEKQGQDEFRKLEQGDKTNRSLWNWFKKESLREFDKMYKRLGIKFTALTGESFYEAKLTPLVRELLKRKIAKQNADGSIVVHLEKESLPPCLMQKSDGASLYATRDVATINYRVQHYKPAQIFYVVGNEQSLHFEQVYAVARRLGYVGSTQLEHLKFGTILGDDGHKFATREGRLIKLDEVLAEAVTRARAIIEVKNSKLPTKIKEQVAEAVGVGALKYNDLSQNRQTDITFSWDKMLSLSGNSSPYLQYSYVRLQSILRKGGRVKGVGSRVKFDKNILNNLTASDLNVLRILIRYPEAIMQAARENGPHLLAQYLYDLANAINSFYQNSPVLQAREPLKSFRLGLIKNVADVLAQGLGILGIKVVERM